MQILPQLPQLPLSDDKLAQEPLGQSIVPEGQLVVQP